LNTQGILGGTKFQRRGPKMKTNKKIGAAKIFEERIWRTLMLQERREFEFSVGEK